MTKRSTLVAYTIRALPVALAVGAVLNQAQAIPAYGRRTGMSCQSCHWGSTNRLTKAGKDFLWRGQRAADEASLTEPKSMQLGDYMSFSSKFRFESDKDASVDNKFDIEALSIYSGGPLFEGFSYFFEMYLHERGKESNSGGTGTVDTAVREKLAEAYLFYNSNPNGDQYWFARAGSFTPRIIHQASTGGRNSISRPFILQDVDGSGNAFTPRDRFYGITGGFVTKDGIRSEVGVTNGGGGNKQPNQPENNNRKDVFGSIEKALDEQGSYVGLFGYSGSYPVSPTFEDEFNRMGVIGAFEREKYNFSGGYFWGKNDVSTGGTRNPKGYYIEAGLDLNSTTTAYARVDKTDFDLGTTKTGGAVGVSFRLKEMGRMAFELVQSKVTGSDQKNVFTFEINWLF